LGVIDWTYVPQLILVLANQSRLYLSRLLIYMGK